MAIPDTTSHTRLVELNAPIGVTTLQMRDASFFTRTAQLFATSPSLPIDDATTWFNYAVRGGAVFG